MKKSNSLFIIFWFFIIASFITNKDVFLICSVIIAVGYFTIKQLEENNQKD